LAPELIFKDGNAGEPLQLIASGSWTAAHAASLEEKIAAIKFEAPGSRRLDIDIAGIGELDTFGAWLLERLGRACIAHGYDARLVEVSGRFRGLLDEMHACSRDKPPSSSKIQSSPNSKALASRRPSSVKTSSV